MTDIATFNVSEFELMIRFEIFHLTRNTSEIHNYITLKEVAINLSVLKLPNAIRKYYSNVYVFKINREEVFRAVDCRQIYAS